MKQNIWQITLLLSGLLLTGLTLWLSNQTSIKILSFLIMLWIICFFIVNRYGTNAKLDKLRIEKTAEAMDLVHKRRHDWMNDLQVLYGYVKLGKMENLLPRTEELTNKLHQESKAANIGLQELEWYFIKLHAFSQKFQLEIEMEEGLELAKIPVNRRRLSTMIIRITELFNQYSQYPSEQQYLTIGFDIHERNKLCCSFRLEGFYDRDGLNEGYQRLKQEYVHRHGISWSEEFKQDEAWIEISLSYVK